MGWKMTDEYRLLDYERQIKWLNEDIDGLNTYISEQDKKIERGEDAEFCLTEMWAAFKTAAPEAAKSFCANINIAKRLCDFVEVGDAS